MEREHHSTYGENTLWKMHGHRSNYPSSILLARAWHKECHDHDSWTCPILITWTTIDVAHRLDSPEPCCTNCSLSLYEIDMKFIWTSYEIHMKFIWTYANMISYAELCWISVDWGIDTKFSEFWVKKTENFPVEKKCPQMSAICSGLIVLM